MQRKGVFSWLAIFKNKRFWTLLPPYFVLGVLLVSFTPAGYKFYSLLAMIIAFWGTYYSWNHLGGKEIEAGNTR